MNTTNIPRYKASQPMQLVFVTNNDGCGDHVFTQIKRQGNVALYSRIDPENDRIVGYEVFTVKVVKAGTVYAKGATPTANATESYPGAQSFGRSAFFCSTLGRANERFAELIKNQQPVDEVSDIPTGEFTLVEFATANCMPPNNVAAGLLQTLLNQKVVKYIKTVEKTPGRKIQWFSKV
jgi:hypothetical protein